MLSESGTDPCYRGSLVTEAALDLFDKILNSELEGRYSYDLRRADNNMGVDARISATVLHSAGLISYDSKTMKIKLTPEARQIENSFYCPC